MYRYVQICVRARNLGKRGSICGVWGITVELRLRKSAEVERSGGQAAQLTTSTTVTAASVRTARHHAHLTTAADLRIPKELFYAATTLCLGGQDIVSSGAFIRTHAG
jgi:hypothetical protein